MATLSIYLKSGQTIKIDGATVKPVPDHDTGETRFEIKSRDVKIEFIDQESIAAIIAEPGWS